MKFLDAHTHLQLPAYDADRDAVISRARAAGVHMVNVGTQAETSRLAVELAEKNDDMWAVVGFHPGHCNVDWYHDVNEQSSPTQEIFDADVFRALAKHPKVVAIGECGLDYYDGGGRHAVTDADKQKQKEVFLAQIEIAHEAGKPLMIHCRDAFPDLIQLLATCHLLLASSPGIIHFFTGTVSEAKQLFDLGFSFTFGGAITFPPRKGQSVGAYDEAIRTIPIENILSETDGADVAPASHRGKRNEPAYIIEVVQKLAKLKNVSVEVMVDQINQNAKRVLGI